jgi:homoserine acetyltransferase
MMAEIIKYELGDVDLVSGETLKSAVLVAKSWGQLSAARDNVLSCRPITPGLTTVMSRLSGPVIFLIQTAIL